MKKYVTFWSILFFTSCTVNVTVDFDNQTFQQQRELWKAANITKYQYLYISLGFSGYEENVVVDGGRCWLSDPDNSSDIREYTDGFYTIDELYNSIEETYLKFNNSIQDKCNPSYFYIDQIHVEYDRVNHIPLSIQYGYTAPEKMAVDGNFTTYIKNFKINE